MSEHHIPASVEVECDACGLTAKKTEFERMKGGRVKMEYGPEYSSPAGRGRNAMCVDLCAECRGLLIHAINELRGAKGMKALRNTSAWTEEAADA